MKIKMTQTISWLNAQQLAKGTEYILDNQISVRLCNEGKAVPVGPIPSEVAPLLKLPAKTKRHKR